MATAAASATVTPQISCCCYVCTCYYCCTILLLLLSLCLQYVLQADPREYGYYASHPLSPHLEPERLINLLRKLHKYRLVIDILYGILAEVSCQRSFRTMRTCTLCCCFYLLLLCFLH